MSMYSAARGGIHPTTMRSQESDQVGAKPLRSTADATPAITYANQTGKGRFTRKKRRSGPVHIPYKQRKRMGSSFGARRWEEDNDPDQERPNIEKMAQKIKDTFTPKNLYA